MNIVGFKQICKDSYKGINQNAVKKISNHFTLLKLDVEVKCNTRANVY